MIFFLFFLLVSNLNMFVNTESNCTFLKNAFAHSTSNFQSCAIENSRPVTFCENCVQFFIDITKTYSNMEESLDNGTTCIEQLVNLDRLQIIQTLYSNSYNLWNNAKCSQCFQIVDEVLTANKSTEAWTFDNLYKNYTHCVANNPSNTTLCRLCAKEYTNLDNYFHSVSNENEAISFCMDMVDKMNATRLEWSKKCCQFRHHNETIFIASSVIVLIITLLFYVVVQFCSIKKPPIILQQRRFAESFSTSNNADL